MRQSSFKLVVCILAFAWVLVCFAPQGIRVCIQSSGEIHTGIGCQCDTCHEPAVGAMCQDGCCNAVSDIAQFEKRCCICMNLLLASAIPSVKLPIAKQYQIAFPKIIALAVFPEPCCIVNRGQQTNVHSPPLLRTKVLRI